MIALIGVIALGVAMAYSMLHNRNRSLPEHVASERGAQQIYKHED